MQDLFEWLFAEDIGEASALPQAPDGVPTRERGVPVPFGFDVLDLRLYWLRCAAAMICEDPLKIANTNRRIFDYVIDSLIVLQMEYRLNTVNLAVVLEVYPRVCKAMMTLYGYPCFSDLRQRFSLMLLLVLCRAISPRHRELACTLLTEVCSDAMMCQEVCSLFTQSNFAYVCAQIIVGPAYDLSIALCKMLCNCANLGGHDVRLYLNSEILVHLVPVS